MYTTVVEHEGKLVYGALNKDGVLLAIFSSNVTVTEEEVCTGCKMRMGICTLAVHGKKAEKLCRICLDKKTGAI
jgi:hypothetical protein